MYLQIQILIINDCAVSDSCKTFLFDYFARMNFVAFVIRNHISCTTRFFCGCFEIVWSPFFCAKGSAFICWN